MCLLFFFSSRRRHTRFDCDWSSDVCSSDLSPRSKLEGLISYCVGVAFGRWDVRIATKKELTPKPQRAFEPLPPRSEEHTSELQSQSNLVCRLLLEKKKKKTKKNTIKKHKAQ